MSSAAMFQGRMPPTMAQASMSDHVLLIERQSPGGKKVPVANGSAVAVGEGVYLTVTHIGSLIDPTVQFVVREAGVITPSLEISKAPALGSSQVSVFFQPPEKETQYLVEAKLHSFPLLPKLHSVWGNFFVKAGTPPVDEPKAGMDWQALIIPAIILVGLVTLGPALGRLIPSRKGD